MLEPLFAALGVRLQGLDATVEVPKGFEGEAQAQQAKDNAKCDEGQVVGHSLRHALRHALKFGQKNKKSGFLRQLEKKRWEKIRTNIDENCN